MLVESARSYPARPTQPNFKEKLSENQSKLHKKFFFTFINYIKKYSNLDAKKTLHESFDHFRGNAENWQEF